MSKNDVLANKTQFSRAKTKSRAKRVWSTNEIKANNDKLSGFAGAE